MCVKFELLRRARARVLAPTFSVDKTLRERGGGWRGSALELEIESAKDYAFS